MHISQTLTHSKTQYPKSMFVTINTSPIRTALKVLGSCQEYRGRCNFSRVWIFSLRYKFYLQLQISCFPQNDKFTSLIFEEILPDNRVWIATVCWLVFEVVTVFPGNGNDSGPSLGIQALLHREDIETAAIVNCVAEPVAQVQKHFL